MRDSEGYFEIDKPEIRTERAEQALLACRRKIVEAVQELDAELGGGLLSVTTNKEKGGSYRTDVWKLTIKMEW